MGILSAFLDLMTEERSEVRLVTARCLRSRLNTCDCRRCLDVCASGALSLVGRRIELDPEKCSACMSCTAVCPNDALVGEHDLLSLVKAISSGPQPVVSCSRSMLQPEGKVTVPCVGIFSEEALLALGHSGRDCITFDLSGCRACGNNHAAARLCGMVEHLHGRAGDLPTRLCVEGVDDGEAGSEPRDRRAYLSHCFAGLSKAPCFMEMPGKYGKVQESGERPGEKRIPTNVIIIEHLVSSADAERQERLRELCCHRLDISGKCTRCRRRSAICPTGALKLQRSEQEDQVVFTATRCSGCGLCVRFCREEAILLRPPRWGDAEPVFHYPGSYRYAHDASS